ncbi:MAG: hypothetical protein QG657_4109, partial [Acidobacteriota bacterium]|nr:hypothetical protein [Acidobacteriota bacterium]
MAAKREFEENLKWIFITILKKKTRKTKYSGLRVRYLQLTLVLVILQPHLSIINNQFQLFSPIV